MTGIAILTLMLTSQFSQAAHLSDELFGLDKVWDIHLQLTPDEWAKLQPPEDMDWDILEVFQSVMQDQQAGGNFHSERSTRPGLAGYFGVDHQYGSGTVKIGDRVLDNVGIRYKGNGTFLDGQRFEKFSFKIDFNEYERAQEFMGMTKINLNSNVTDASMMREALSYELFREAGINCSRVTWAKVSLTVPGLYDNRYLGLYSIVEQVDKRFLRHRYRTGTGMLLKPSTFGAFRYFEDDWAAYKRAYVPKTDVTPDQAKRLMDFARLVQLSEDAMFERDIESYLDMDHFLRFLAVNVLLSNLDSFLGGTQNHYVYLDPGSNKFQLLPWDMDHSFGALPLVGTAETRAQLSIDKPQVGKNRLIERVLAIPVYREKHRRYIGLYTKTLFRQDKILRTIDATSEFLRPLVALSGKAAVDRFDDSLSDSPIPVVLGLGMAMLRIKPFAVSRMASVQAQLEGKSSGEVLTMNKPPPGTLKQWLVVFIAGAIALLMNLIAYVRGVIAGFRGSSLWGCLNLLLYPMTTVFYGYRVRMDLGYRQARMAVWSTAAFIAVVVISWAWIVA